MSPGSETTEFKLTKWAVILGAVLEALSVALHSMEAGGVTAPWFPGVLAVVGVLLQVASLLGYKKSRTILKAEEIRSSVPPKPPA